MKNYQDNELVSSLTHLLGFFLSIVGLILLIDVALKYSTVWHLVAFSVFGASLISLYLASTVYHFIPRSSRFKKTFRRIDLAFIFFLIAGTYTPILLVPLRGVWGWSILAVVWTLALVGMGIQAFKIRVRTWVNVAMYLGMGWIIMSAWPVLLTSLTKASFAWLLAGGISYTLGTVFYILDDILPPNRWFSMHDVFHIFVLGGSFSHFWLMYKYITFI